VRYVEKKQYDLCQEVLRRLEAARVLDGLILIGSWCLLLYREYFRGIAFRPSIRTRDLDFLIPLPQRFAGKVDLHALLQDLGFVLNFKGDAGWITFHHPDLILEFLVPERGRGTHKPTAVPALGVNAQALRFLDFLAVQPVRVDFHGIAVRVPHPANFALHKLVIAPRRKSEKADRDRTQAVQVLQALVQSGEGDAIPERFAKLPAGWRRPIRAALAEMKEDALLELIA
jgi:hypothetical protein